ncbi:hypothetical protein Q7P37_009080 [Cladosporium fusiforme]
MAARAAILATAVLGTIVTLYHFTSSPQTAIMPSVASDQSSQGISVELSAAEAPLTIRVTIRNDSPDHPFSFLTWDSPFDPQAINTGVLSLKDDQSGSEIEGPAMKLNRLLPPPRDDIVEIKPGSSATRELGLASPWVPTDGKTYQIQAHGSWRAAWAKSASDVTDKELEAMGIDEKVAGAFSSDALKLQLKQ